MNAHIKTPDDADLVSQLQRALVRRTSARRDLVEMLLLLEVAERSVPGRAAELEARCAEAFAALREAEDEIRTISRVSA